MAFLGAISRTLKKILEKYENKNQKKYDDWMAENWPPEKIELYQKLREVEFWYGTDRKY